VEVAHEGAEGDFKAFPGTQPAAEFHGGPRMLAGLGRIVGHRQVIVTNHFFGCISPFSWSVSHLSPEGKFP
jgi:hypothetical protein